MDEYDVDAAKKELVEMIEGAEMTQEECEKLHRVVKAMLEPGQSDDEVVEARSSTSVIEEEE